VCSTIRRRLLVESEKANSEPRVEDIHVGIVATPFVIRQIQSDGQAMSDRRGPNIHITSNFPRVCPFLGSFPLCLADDRIAGTDLLVNQLPMLLLTFLGLCIRTGAWEKRGSALVLEESTYQVELTQ